MLRHAPLLRQFLAVVREGSLSGAAHALAVTQPALTKSIQKLEAELGVKLFERLPRGIALTQYGEALLPYAQRIDTECSIADLELQAFGRGQVGRLRVGAGEFFSTALVPQAIAAVQARFPGIRFELVSAVTDEIYGRLAQGELDIIMGALPEVDKLPEFLSLQRFQELGSHVVAGVQHPLASKAKVRGADLADYPWAILHHDRQIIRRLPTVLGGGRDADGPHISVELTSLGALVQLLRSGPYLSCMVDHLCRLQPHLGITVLACERPVWRYATGAVMHASLQRYQPATMFVELVRKASRITA